MSHVDDGQLHAYLDGAYPPGDEQGERIASHLGSCVDCRVRLEDARGLREKVGLVMRHAAPAALEPPTFDAILERARAARERGVPGPGTSARPAGDAHGAPRRWRRMPLAWAASLMMALAAGWLASDLFRRYDAESARAPAALDEAEAALDEVRGAAPADALRSTRDEMTASGTEAVDAGAARLRSGDGRGGVQGGRAAGARSAVAAPPPTASLPATGAVAGEPPPVAQSAAKAADDLQRQIDPGVAGRADVANLQFRVGAAAETAPVVPLYLVGDSADLDAAALDWAVTLSENVAAATAEDRWVAVSDEEAERRLGVTPASLPNATRRSFEIAGPENEPILRAVYDLADGRTAELIQRPAPAPTLADAAMAFERREQRAPERALVSPGAPAAPVRARLATLFRERSAVAVQRPRLWIVLAAPLPAAELAALAERIR